MVDSEGKPTLIDFGASRAALAGRSTTFTSIFTPGYAAAEQFAAKKLGPWTDIYGLAATLYHAIAGKSPPSAIERVFTDECQPLVELQPAGYSLGFLESIDAGLAVSSADRPQSVGEWRRMLASSLDATRIARSPGRLARAASRTRRARVSLGAPTIGLAAAVGVALLGAVGYFVFSSNAPVAPTVSTAALLSAEQLEQALAERRKADAHTADMARREDEARQKAQAEAEAKRQADEALEQTRQARQQAEQELAELNARLEAQRRDNSDQASRAAAEAAQRKAEQDAAALAEAEQRAVQKAAADAEAKRQADEALAKAEAERQRAEQEARQKAEAEQAALRQASEDAQRKAADAESVKQAERERLKAEAERAKAETERQKAEAEAKAKAEAETAEKALRLEQADRQRLQVALTSLGFDTRGSDGVFGPRSREMVAGWQKKAGVPATGFLTAAQRDQLLRNGAYAIARWDDEQKKVEEQKKAEEEKKKLEAMQAATLNQPGSAASTPPASGPAVPAVAAAGPAALPSPDGLWRGTYGCNVPIGSGGSVNPITMDFEIRLVSGSGTWTSAGPTAANGNTFSIHVSVSSPKATVARHHAAAGGGPGLGTPASIMGQYDGYMIRAVGWERAHNNQRECTVTLRRA